MESLSRSVCRSCRLQLQLKKTAASSVRTFTTSSTKLYIPPESPTFIDFPEAYQSVRERRAPTKGLLPVPRELFPRSRPDKPSAQYLQNVTPDALPKNIPPPEFQTDARKYKLRMSEMRKSHLREGLTQLHSRKVIHEKRVLRKGIIKQEQSSRLVHQTEREDSRLTNNTVLSTMKPQRLMDLPEEEELAIFEARKARYEEIQSAKREERLDKLHTLYMNARKFITNKDQLAAAIEEEFEKPVIWKLGVPSSLKDMLTGRASTDSRIDIGSISNLVPSNDRFLRDQDRMKRIAEKLSGGKM